MYGLCTSFEFSLSCRGWVRVDERCQADNEHGRVDQTARVGDLDGRLLLVAGQHPDLDAGLAQLLDRLRHAVLQLVLDARGADEQQLLLDLVDQLLLQMLLVVCRLRD